MLLKKIQDADVADKKVLLRADFNVSLEDGKVKEAFKIRVLEETLKLLLEKKAKVAICSHFGRPDGQFNEEFSLFRLKESLENILNFKMVFMDDCLSGQIPEALENLKDGEVLLLENVRFHPGDENNESDFSNRLAAPFDVFVNDAFSVCHRDQGSVTGVAQKIPAYAGMRLQKEIEALSKVKDNPEHPAVAVIGGAKIETKLPVIQFFEKNFDRILVGGKIANEALEKGIQFSDKVMLPEDFSGEKMDIGTETVKKFSAIVVEAKTVVWNGPMGKFEEPEFAVGTEKILEAILASSAYSVLGGGETLEILEQKNAYCEIGFVSTGGGAMLEFLGGNTMPGLEVLRG
jgi:phosphoglycerate kinase